MEGNAQLQIVLSVLDNATKQLQDAQAAIAGLGTAAEEASEQITDALTPAEDAIIEQAMAAASAWQGAGEDIASSVEEFLPTVTEAFEALAETNQEAAIAVAQAWREQAQSMEQDLASALDTMSADLSATEDEMVAKTATSTGSMHSYFRLLVAGYMALSAGEGITGFVQSMVNAASPDPTKIKELSDQIQQAKASIDQQEASLQTASGTLDQINAKHQAVAASVASEREKIAELTPQLKELQTQQQLGGQAAQEYADATLKLSNDWTTFLATSGKPMLTMFTDSVKAIDDIVTKMTAWADANPKAAQTLLVFLEIVGGLLVVLGAVLLAIAPIVIATMLLSAVFGALSFGVVAAGAAMILTVAAIAAYIITHWDQIKKATEDLLAAVVVVWDEAWQHVSDFFTKIWTGIQTTMQSAINFIKGLLQDLLNFAATVTSKVLAPISAIANIAAPIFNAVGGAIGGALNAIPKMANGGVVTSPTYALIGEAGPEAVIPLSAFSGGSSLGARGGGNSGGGINIYIQGGNYLDSNGATMIGNALAQSVIRQMKLKNYS